MDEILNEYTKRNPPTIHNFRGIKNSQMRAYRFEYDYVMFFDVDEFLI